MITLTLAAPGPIYPSSRMTDPMIQLSADTEYWSYIDTREKFYHDGKSVFSRSQS